MADSWRNSVNVCILLHPRDWSLNPRDAWLWGIVVGWKDAAMQEVSEKHGWPEETVDRLKRLRADYVTEGM